MTLMNLAADHAVIAIRDERIGDNSARERLLDAALGQGRRRKTSERLREWREPARGLSLVATDGDAIVGTIRLWHVDAGGVPALLLGPLAVADSHREMGIGSRLICEALFRTVQQGHRAVLLVGDAPYYVRFGFGRVATRNLAMPGPVEIERFLGLELEPGALDRASGLVVATGERVAAIKARRAA
jgi:predicted N-acetyltransferase YhbS